MQAADFQHVGLSMVGDVAVVEVLTKDLQGPRAAQELGDEMGQVLAQEWARRVLVNFHRVGFLSSTGFAALFKLVAQAKAGGRDVRFCEMASGVRLGAEIVQLEKVAAIYDTERQALEAFAKA